MSFRVLSALTAMLFLIVSVPVLVQRAAERTATENFGVGDPDVFVKKYLAFRAERLKSGSPDVLTIPIGFVKGLSRSFTGAAGQVVLDLRAGVVTVNVSGLTAGVPHSVWLVDGVRALREPDQTVKLADIAAGRQSATVSRTIAAVVPPGFMIDRIVVARGIESPDRVVASGSLNVFQKLFSRRASLRNESTESVLFADSGQAPAFAEVVGDLERETTATQPDVANSVARLVSALSPAVEAAGLGVPLDRLISQGARLFFEQRFGGNGRTCGTCHPASNNFTIDPAFIATLPNDNPLFVAEFNEDLAELERPELMRKFGLILENVDGLEDPTNKFVMRGVPHTLGLQVSMQRDPSLTNGPAEMTGWSGDGAPVSGSLRDFAIGAVTQHFTRSLARRRGIDFFLPNEHQLDAMEAFQLSLGRDADFNLATLTFLDMSVQNGKSLFVNGTGAPSAAGRCSTCHGNAGALLANGQNRNFNTNVEDVVHPARSVENFPVDGGFGQTPANPDGSFGNRAFNTVSVVEAADTAPFFHNNVAATLEDVLEFYTGPSFNNPRPPAGRFAFTPSQKTDLLNFVRAINTLQNIDVAKRELEEILALTGDPQNEIASRLVTAHSDTRNAIVVLGEGGIFPAAAADLTAARQFISNAQQTIDPAARRQLILQALAELGEATDSMTP
jgi:cytochrome c peroxidase